MDYQRVIRGLSDCALLLLEFKDGNIWLLFHKILTKVLKWENLFCNQLHSFFSLALNSHLYRDVKVEHIYWSSWPGCQMDSFAPCTCTGTPECFFWSHCEGVFIPLKDLSLVNLIPINQGELSFLDHRHLCHPFPLHPQPCAFLLIREFGTFRKTPI